MGGALEHGLTPYEQRQVRDICRQEVENVLNEAAEKALSEDTVFETSGGGADPEPLSETVGYAEYDS